ncbi:Rho termination factor N-terminal domain-containing protein [Staphylococcus arlettae]|uniref:Rho termination factor N-terminal domain-containing protein n=1 Tax=Staphylococcus arlettae TaxID=29378 RepID=UPI001E602BF5|nr:Rho termination factor N-terminal domain-containing protein [Staphylococcus arlettae]MCD8832750.1 Rho termination factor N-terminal domain-containing protein [Staphylococcus arlettae]
MAYEVIKYFTDLQDNDYEYNVGDVFPREGLKVNDDRLKELSTNKNRQRTPLIKAVFEDINYSDMKVAELKEIARKRGIEGYNDMKKSELVKVLEGE